MATLIKLKSGHWMARIRKAGFPPQSKTFVLKDEAQAWAMEVEATMLRGSFVSRKEAETTTLREAFDRYLREVTPTKKSAKRETARIRQIQATDIASRPLASVRGMDVAAYRDERLKAVKPAVVRLEMAAISHLYTIARTEWGMDYLANPCNAARAPRVDNARDRRFGPGEEEAIRKCLDPEMDAVVTVALETAMRRGEIASLRWDMIRGAVAKLPTTKNGTARSVPLSSVARAALASLPRRIDGRVFGVYIDDMTRRFQDACRAAGVADMRFHDLRHEATSRLFEKGFAIMEVAAITGHKSLAMLKRYTHLDASELARRLG